MGEERVLAESRDSLEKASGCRSQQRPPSKTLWDKKLPLQQAVPVSHVTAEHSNLLRSYHGEVYFLERLPLSPIEQQLYAIIWALKPDEMLYVADYPIAKPDNPEQILSDTFIIRQPQLAHWQRPLGFDLLRDYLMLHPQLMATCRPREYDAVERALVALPNCLHFFKREHGPLHACIVRDLPRLLAALESELASVTKDFS